MYLFINFYRTGCQTCTCETNEMPERCYNNASLDQCDFEKYMFNPKTKFCEKINYGSCSSGFSNFESCRKTCRGVIPEIICPKRPCRPCPLGAVKDINGCFTCICITKEFCEGKCPEGTKCTQVANCTTGQCINGYTCQKITGE